MPGMFSPPPPISDPDMHHATCVKHVLWCMPGSLTSGFLWSRWRGKRSRHSRRMRNLQFYVSGKRPIADVIGTVTTTTTNTKPLEQYSSIPCGLELYMVHTFHIGYNNKLGKVLDGNQILLKVSAYTFEIQSVFAEYELEFQNHILSVTVIQNLYISNATVVLQSATFDFRSLFTPVAFQYVRWNGCVVGDKIGTICGNDLPLIAIPRFSSTLGIAREIQSITAAH